ncbi:MAG: hypothetical protein ACJ716_08340 [Marmoricola sp.]
MTRVLAAAAVVGFVMHVAARIAADPGRDWLQWVVNWGALWVGVPFFAGRRSRGVTAAVLLGAAAGATEVAVYYGVVGLATFQVVWLVVGAMVSGVAGAVGRASRRYRFGLLFLPVLLVLEPLVVTAGFLALGRHVGGPHWIASCLAEALAGVVAGCVLAANALKARVAI